MHQKLWFKAKRYGWGWYPATWQGWIITLLYILGIIWFAVRIDAESHSVSDTLYGIVVPFGVLTMFMIAICYKTGEKPRWRWGNKK